jgi:hypothetical protein
MAAKREQRRVMAYLDDLRAKQAKVNGLPFPPAPTFIVGGASGAVITSRDSSRIAPYGDGVARRVVKDLTCIRESLMETCLCLRRCHGWHMHDEICQV